MKKKPLVITILLILVLAIAAGVYILSIQKSGKTDEEIRKMFDCNRITADIRATDIYCGDPNLYRNHLKENKVIGPSDFNRLQ